MMMLLSYAEVACGYLKEKISLEYYLLIMW